MAKSKSPKASGKDPMKQATMVRRLVLRNPDITLEEVQKAWDKAGYPRSGRPKNDHPIYMARTLLKKKYGLKNISDIPRKKSGDINVTGLLRLLRSKNPKITQGECRKLLAADGVEFSAALWSVMISYDSNKQSTGSGEKVTAVRSHTRKVVRRSPRKTNDQTDLIEMENHLDQMIEHARMINQSEMVQMLKNARRHVSQSILDASR